MFYVLAGLNIGIGSATASYGGYSASASTTSMGINLGGGLSLPLSDALDFFAQAGYTAGGANQLFVNAGLMIKFGK